VPKAENQQGVVPPHGEDGAQATGQADAGHEKGQLDEAAAAYRRALRLDETLADAWYGLGRVELDRGATSEAVRCFRRVLTLEPGRARAHFNLGKSLFDLGEIDAALDHLRVAADGTEAWLRHRALAAMACIVPGSLRADHATVLKTRREWARLEAANEMGSGQQSPKPTASGGKLRVGYCSRFFHAQNWMKPIWGAINHHDRSAFAIHLFSDGPPPLPEGGYRESPADCVHDVRGLSNRDLADLVNRTGIDILVDLNGYSFQPRLGLFLRRPAPVSITWFNMYATSGIEAFDYIIGDDVVVTPGEEHFYCERVLRVPGSYLAFSVAYPVPEVTPPPSAAAGHITFGSFCSLYKITDEVIAAWSTILRRAAGVKLFLKNGNLGVAANRAAVIDRFTRRDITPDRLLLAGPANHYDFLAAYSQVDIALDTFPYNGGTTTTEALWQGVPVLSFHGDRWASRQSHSLLRAAGLEDWCQPDLERYIDRAVTLAQSPDTPAELTLLRATMREHLASMPICDSAGLCHALERIYQEVAR